MGIQLVTGDSVSQAFQNSAQVLACSRDALYTRIGKPKLPLGGQATLDHWIKLSGCSLTSRVLIPDCGTGLTAIAAALTTGATVEGFDRCDWSVETARSHAANTGVSSRIRFQSYRGETLGVENGLYTHVFLSPFVNGHWSRPSRLEEMARVLKKAGKLCTADYRPERNLAAELAEDAYAILGLDLRRSCTCEGSSSQVHLLFERKEVQISAPLSIDMDIHREESRLAASNYAKRSHCDRDVEAAVAQRLVREGEVLSRLREFGQVEIGMLERR